MINFFYLLYLSLASLAYGGIGDRMITGMIFFSYLTDFSYFSLKIVYRKLLDTVA